MLLHHPEHDIFRKLFAGEDIQIRIPIIIAEMAGDCRGPRWRTNAVTDVELRESSALTRQCIKARRLCDFAAVARQISVAQVVRVDQRRRRIDEVIIGERPAVDFLRRVFQAEMPDLGQSLVGPERSDGPQLLQRRLNRINSRSET